MILPDVSILVNAYNSDSSHFEAARAWWEDTLTRPRPVGLPWVSVLGFVRITTHSRILDRPLRPADAVHLVRSWLNMPGVQILTPGEMHAQIFFRLIEHVGTAGDLTTDAHLARWRSNIKPSWHRPTPISRGFPACVGLTPSRHELLVKPLITGGRGLPRKIFRHAEAHALAPGLAEVPLGEAFSTVSSNAPGAYSANLKPVDSSTVSSRPPVARTTGTVP